MYLSRFLSIHALWVTVSSVMQPYPLVWGHYDVCKTQIYTEEGKVWDYMACQPESTDMTKYLKVKLDPPDITCGDPPEAFCAMVRRCFCIEYFTWVAFNLMGKQKWRVWRLSLAEPNLQVADTCWEAGIILRGGLSYLELQYIWCDWCMGTSCLPASQKFQWYRWSVYILQIKKPIWWLNFRIETGTLGQLDNVNDENPLVNQH